MKVGSNEKMSVKRLNVNAEMANTHENFECIQIKSKVKHNIDLLQIHTQNVKYEYKNTLHYYFYKQNK